MKRAIVTVALLFSVGAPGCSKHQVAQVKKHEGDVKRDTSSSQQKWQPAPDGAELGMGDGLKTGPSATAVLHLTNGGNIAVSSDTTIRFLASKPGARQPKLAIETGEASVEAADTALTVETTIGLAQIEPGGKLHISADGTSTRVEVTVGAARIETDDGGVALSPGKSFEVALGGAIVEREALDASADSGRADRVDAAAPAAAADAGAAGATTIEVRGAGVRVQAKGETAFKPVAEGSSSASAGDVFEVPNGASVDVRRGARHGRFVGFGRFAVGDADGTSLGRASSGRVELEATTEDVVVEVPGGAIVAKTGEGKSRVDADVGAAGTKVAVGQGQGEVRGKGPAETIRAGEHATLTAKGTVVVSNRGPERPDFTVRAGDSVVVRDPRPPTALGFDFSSACPGAAVVSRADGAATVRGEHKAAMSLAAGRHEYAIRCIGPDGVEEKVAASGTVTIVPDAARAELASLPPSTVVDMDGRRYTVLYQNLLPSVIARWTDAPKAGSYALFVDKARTKSTTPKQSLKPGSIGEGTHTLRFETDDGTQKSAETTLVIKFDNAAPAASVRDPVDGSFQPGDSVKVSGAVAEGWTVSVNGAAVPLDEQRRFSTTATVPAGENALVLRLSHPKRGTVYYVRHASGAAGGAH